MTKGQFLAALDDAAAAGQIAEDFGRRVSSKLISNEPTTRQWVNALRAIDQVRKEAEGAWDEWWRSTMT